MANWLISRTVRNTKHAVMNAHDQVRFSKKKKKKKAGVYLGFKSALLKG